MKKKVLVIICINILLAFIVVFFNIENTKFIDNIIDMYVDKNDNIYYLELKNEKYCLYKVDKNGKILIKENLSEKSPEGNIYFYYKLAVDNNDNIYIITVENEKIIYDNGKLDYKYIDKYVKIYDNKGTEKGKILNDESSYTNQYLFDLQYIGGNIVTSKIYDDSTIKIFEYNTTQGVFETTYQFKNDVNIREIIYTGKREVYYVNHKAELFYINDKDTKKLDLDYEGSETIIPYGLSLDQYGNLTFTDVHNFNFMKFNKEENKFYKVYGKDDIIVGNIKFSDIRDVEYQGEKFIGYFSDEGKYYNKNSMLITHDDKYHIIKYKHMSFIDLIITFIIYFCLTFIILIAILGLIYISINTKSLLFKQMQVISIMMIIMIISIIYIFEEEIKTTLQDKLIKPQFIYMLNSARDVVNGDVLKNSKFPIYDNDDYYWDIVNKLWDAEKKQNSNTNLDKEIDADYSYKLYYINNDIIYTGIVEYKPFEDKSISGMRKEYSTPFQNGETIFYDKETDTKIEIIKNMYGKKFVGSVPIFDSQKQLVGYVEIQQDERLINYSIKQISIKIIYSVVSISFILIFILMLILKKSLKELKILKKGVISISDGNWGNTINIKSNDEIGDIGSTFNKMSFKIKNTLDSIIKYNNAYEKFVPDTFFKLLDKGNVLEVKLGDQSIKNMNLMRVQTKNFFEISKDMSTFENFEFLNSFFSSSAEIIEKTEGVIEDFEGAGFRAIYTENADKAIDAALWIIEKVNTHNIKIDKDIQTGIIIQNGDIMVGIVGHEDRMEATIISEMVNYIFVLEKFIEVNKISLLITSSVYLKINKKNKYNCRYIGKIRNPQYSNSFIDLYDVIDSYPYNKRKNKLITKENFEQGVNYYINQNFKEARKSFIDVIQIDNDDEISKEYIFLCDKYINGSIDSWEGIIG